MENEGAYKQHLYLTRCLIQIEMTSCTERQHRTDALSVSSLSSSVRSGTALLCSVSLMCEWDFIHAKSLSIQHFEQSAVSF